MRAHFELKTTKNHLSEGDFAAFPANEDGGRQVINSGNKPLGCLMISTMNEPGVTLYPEIEKFGVFVGAPPGGREERTFHAFYNTTDEIEYWKE